MKETETTLHRTDRIRVRPFGENSDFIRIGEVLAVVRIPPKAWGELYVAVRYLDDKGEGFECIPLTQVEGLCEDGTEY